MKQIMQKTLAALLALTLLFTPIFAHGSTKVEIPTVNALGAVLIDAETGRLLWGKNEHTPMAMASTTKIMTAVLALESGRMDETVTVSKRAASAPKVKMGLSTGEKLRLGELMYALMLESSNDAAVAIAEHLGGSVEAFCAKMTEKAKEAGARDTVFETPNGLDLGDHHSTAYDLAQIARYALKVPGFIELTNTSNANFSSDRRTYQMDNFNRLLREYEGANGVKTGFTGKAGHCFVGAARRGGMQLISVVLASGWGEAGKQRKWSDTKSVLNYGFNNYEYVNVVVENDSAGRVPVTRSRTDSIECAYAKGLRLPLNEDEKELVKIEPIFAEFYPAPV
ncbi:MAG: D-alanyl-D-alanine carboxypeptidase, partial [Defluviitaleaceae bacterium]|nr:D-alanyl-D-alanine carboxypeptidase [Defluviitaleaceae bacterium]